MADIEQDSDEYDDARASIIHFIGRHKQADPVFISDSIRIPIETVELVLDQLQREGLVIERTDNCE